MKALSNILLRSTFVVLSLVIFLLLIFPSLGITQGNMQDVVYLNNGSIIKGIIIEQVPNKSIKIQTKDGSIFFYRLDEIQKLTKEQPINYSPLGNSAYSFNPLGFLQFGPVFAGEFRLSDNTFIMPRWRIASLGLLYNIVVDYDELSASSMGIGIGTRRYYGTPNSPNKYYFGGYIDYGWGSGKDDVGEPYETVYNHKYILIMSDFGHRWRNSSNIFTNFGVLTGIISSLSDIEIDENGKYENDSETLFIIMLEFSVGFEK